MLEAWLKSPVLAVPSTHVGVVAVEPDGRGIGPVAGFEQAAGRPAVGAIDPPAAPAGLAIGAADARQLAAGGGLLPIRIELQVVAEVDFLGLCTDALAKLVAKASSPYARLAGW